MSCSQKRGGGENYPPAPATSSCSNLVSRLVCLALLQLLQVHSVYSVFGTVLMKHIMCLRMVPASQSHMQTGLLDKG